MKYFGSISTFTKQRNDDLMRAYREKLAEVRHISIHDIFRRVSETPSARFWVSEERAANVINTLYAGKPLPIMGRKKREMFQEIYRRFLILKNEFPKKSVYELVSRIVVQPAPSFYLTPRTVGVLIYRIKNGWYEKRYDRNRDSCHTKGER